MNDAAFERPLAWLISFVLVYKICYVPRELHGFGDVASNEKIDFPIFTQISHQNPVLRISLVRRVKQDTTIDKKAL